MDAYCQAIHVNIWERTRANPRNAFTVKVDLVKDSMTREFVGAQFNMTMDTASEKYPGFCKGRLCVDLLRYQGRSDSCLYSFELDVQGQFQVKHLLDTLREKGLKRYYYKVDQHGLGNGCRGHVMEILSAFEKAGYIKDRPKKWNKSPNIGEKYLDLDLGDGQKRSLQEKDLEETIFYILRIFWGPNSSKFLEEMELGQKVKPEDLVEWGRRGRQAAPDVTLDDDL